jgi:hypothetical protein
MSVFRDQSEAPVVRQADDGILHGGIGPEHPSRGQHDIADSKEEPPPNASSWMEGGEVFPAEPLDLEQRHGQCIAQGERDGSAGGGREIVGTGFLDHGAVQGDRSDSQ